MAIVINGSGTVTGISVGGLPDGIVDAGTVADDAIDSQHYAAASIDNAHIGNYQVTTGNIGDDNITTAKLAGSCVTNAKMADDSVDSAEIVDGAIDAVHLASGVGGKVLAVTEFNNTSAVTFSTDGDVTGYTMSYTRPAGAASSNKLLLHLDIRTGHNESNSTSHNMSLWDGSTEIASYNNFSLLDGSTNNPNRLTMHSAIHKLYSPSSASNITFYIKGNYGGGGGGGDTTFQIKSCVLTIIELSY